MVPTMKIDKQFFFALDILFNEGRIDVEVVALRSKSLLIDYDLTDEKLRKYDLITITY